MAYLWAKFGNPLLFYSGQEHWGREATGPLATAARDGGFLVNNAVPDRVRLAPPLVLTEGQAKEFLDALPGVLDAAGGA